MSLSQSSSITLKELSKLSGFSISTVSKALNNKFDISKDTRKAIQKIALKYNYVPHNYAVALRKKQTKTVAIIIPQINKSIYGLFVYHIEKVASKFGYRIILFQSFEETKREKDCLKSILDGSVDGVIISSAKPSHVYYKKIKNQFPIEHICLSKEVQEQQLKDLSIHTFSKLLSNFD
ncbi:LacI family transcriptional regulator [Kordia periserrulae]|uniref:LacI family transcriptional regulator n=1 Tax=Kordia periserrulae TaxID=701523 RepID=A0A2T6C1Y0_9FLAO|nr:LacI family DNA-binding transcriptional regulator [Kordia periserrulae]PTX62247.1 LacI family transcriptional regulator [Kordia periserrulae]